MEKTKKKQNVKVIVAALVMSAFIATFNETILNLALNGIMEEFSVNTATVQWVITAYMLVTSVMVPITAFLYESIPTKKLFLGAQTFLLVGTVLCVFSNSIPMLMVSRMVQAVGTGMMIPIMMNTILLIAPKEKVGAMMALGTSGITLGPALGPAVSGVVLNYTNWHMLFVGLFVFIAIITIIGGISIQNVSELKKPKLDILSVILSIVGLAIFVYGISIIMTNISLSIAFLAVGAAILAVFVKRQTKLKQPMINLAPFSNKIFNIAVILAMTAMMTSFSMNIIMPIFLEGARGMSTLLTAGVMLPASITLAIVTAISGRLLDKFGPNFIIPFGFVIITVALIAVALLGKVSVPILAIMVAFIVVYIGIGFSMSPSQTSAVSRLPKEIYPDGVAIMNTFTQVAACIGLSLFSGVLTVYQEKAISAGKQVQDAVAAGFSHAVILAAVIAFVALLFSLAFVVLNKKASKINPEE